MCTHIQEKLQVRADSQVKDFPIASHVARTPTQMQQVWKGRVAEWLTDEWLAANPKHEVSRLFSRHDRLARCELALLGSGLEVAALSNASSALKAWKKDIKDPSPNNTYGACWEIICTRLLTTSGTRVVPLKGNAPGYDIDVHHMAGVHFRVSCKRLGDHETQKLLRKATVQLSRHLKEQLPVGQPTRVIVEFNVKVLQSIDDHIRSVASIISSEVLKQHPRKNVTIQSSGITFRLDPIHSKHRYDFHPDMPSFLLCGLIEHRYSEQKRLVSMFETAANKFRKQDFKPEERIANLVAIRVPEASDFEKFSREIEGILGANGQYVSGVLLFGTRIVESSSSPDKLAIGHRYLFISNPSATFSLDNVCSGLEVKLGLPVGIGIDNALPLHITIDGLDHSLEQYHVHTTGLYQYLVKPKSLHENVIFERLRNIDAAYWVSGKHALYREGVNYVPAEPFYNATELV